MNIAKRSQLEILKRASEAANKLIEINVLPPHERDQFILEYIIMAETIIGTTLDALVAKASGAQSLPPSPFDKATSDDVTALNNAIASLSGTGTGVAPVFLTPTTGTITSSSGGTYTVVTSGTPAPVLTSGALPSGVTLSGNSLIVASGSPTGTFTIALTATSSAGTEPQSFTLIIA